MLGGVATHAYYDEFAALNCQSGSSDVTIKYLFDQCGDQPALRHNPSAVNLVNTSGYFCPGFGADLQRPTTTYVDMSAAEAGGAALVLPEYDWPDGGTWGVTMWVRFKEASVGAALLTWGDNQVILVVDHTSTYTIISACPLAAHHITAVSSAVDD